VEDAQKGRVGILELENRGVNLNPKVGEKPEPKSEGKLLPISTPDLGG